MEDDDGWGGNSLEEDVNNWIACAFEEYAEVVPMVHSVTENVIKIEMKEKVYKIEVDSESGVPKSIQENSGTASAKIQQFLDICNAKFNKAGSIDSLPESLNFMISKFQKIVIDGEVP
jgi:hypothetical protein